MVGVGFFFLGFLGALLSLSFVFWCGLFWFCFFLFAIFVGGFERRVVCWWLKGRPAGNH